MARHRRSMIRPMVLRLAVVCFFVAVIAGAAGAYEVPSREVVVRSVAVTEDAAAAANPAANEGAVIEVLDPVLQRAYDIRYGVRYSAPPQLGPFLPAGTVAESPLLISASTQRPVFPAVPTSSGSGRRIVYDRSEQRVWLISETGRILDSYLVSGRLNEPRPGTYRVYSKSLKAVAFYQGITFDWMVRFAYGSKNGISIGFHDLPLYADGTPMMTEDQFGTPLSGGCIRQPNYKARSLYGWADIRTVVVVLP